MQLLTLRYSHVAGLTRSSIRTFAFEITEGRSRGMISTHAMHSSTWGRGCGTKIKPGNGCRIGAQGGADEDLPQISRATGDITTDEIGVMTFEKRRRHHVASQDQIPKARGKAFHLSFDAFRHIEGRSIRYVTVGAASVFS